jgi:hypothetical protein
MNTEKTLEIFSGYVLNSGFKTDELTQIIDDLNGLFIMTKVDARKKKEEFSTYVASQDWKDSQATRDYLKLKLIKLISEL